MITEFFLFHFSTLYTVGYLAGNHILEANFKVFKAHPIIIGGMHKS